MGLIKVNLLSLVVIAFSVAAGSTPHALGSHPLDLHLLFPIKAKMPLSPDPMNLCSCETLQYE
jgi:hypothetical protein